VHYLTAAEEAAWKKAVKPVYQGFTTEIGADLVREAQREVEELGKAKK
jgi:hypothetical protein